MKGKLHSLESFGAVDGLGIRFVVFTQGCPLRCLYCHNPDTWKLKDNKYEHDVSFLIHELVKYKDFLVNGGGITVTGGEPLMQSEFVKELFIECKKKGIHTALDTSGYIFNDKVKELLEVTELVLLDIKCIDEEEHKNLTGVELQPILDFANYLSHIKKPMWIRHVLLPGYTDKDEQLQKLSDFVKTLNSVERVEILPFHKMGEYKWKELGLEYRLKDIEDPSEESIEHAKSFFDSIYM